MVRFLIGATLILAMTAWDGQAQAFEPGQVFRDCTDCPEMVVVPAGSIIVGEGNINNPTTVTFAHSYAIGRFEVTRGQFAAFVRESGHDAGNDCYTWQDEWPAEGLSWRSPGFSQEDDHPVVCVNWLSAKAYAAWLAEKTGQPYRLPSDSEWEYAARAGTHSFYYWGDRPSHEKANYGRRDKDVQRHGDDPKYAFAPLDSGVTEGRDRWIYTAPIGSFEPNGFGVYDTAGNVWELNEDIWHTEDYAAPPEDGGPRHDPPAEIRTRSMRGGSWLDGGYAMRGTDDNYMVLDIRGIDIGFRVMRE